MSNATAPEFGTTPAMRTATPVRLGMPGRLPSTVASAGESSCGACDTCPRATAGASTDDIETAPTPVTSDVRPSPLLMPKRRPGLAMSAQPELRRKRIRTRHLPSAD